MFEEDRAKDYVLELGGDYMPAQLIDFQPQLLVEAQFGAVAVSLLLGLALSMRWVRDVPSLGATNRNTMCGGRSQADKVAGADAG